MSNIVNKTFSGLADFYMGVYGGGVIAPVGSISKATLSHTEDVKNSQNYGKDAGLLNTFSRLTAIPVSLTLQSVSGANLAIATRGAVTYVTSGTVTTASPEAVSAYASGLCPLARVGATAVVVKDATDTTTYIAGTDYTVTGSGLVIVPGGAISVAAAAATPSNQVTLHVSYAYPAQVDVEPLVSVPQEYVIVYDGVNQAEQNNIVGVRLHRFKPQLVKTLDLIGADFISMQIDGQLLLDANQVGDAVSKFYKWVNVGTA